MKDANIKTIWPLIGNSHISEYLKKSIISGHVAGTYIFSGLNDLGKATTAKYFAKILLCQSGERDKSGEPCGVCPSCRIFDRAKDNASDLAGLHGDFHLIKRAEGKKNITIEQVREFINKLSLGSFLNSYKVGIIKNAENLSIEAANALLKTLEEPKKKVVIILTVSSAELLPPTIISRSMVLRFRPVSFGEIHDYLVENFNITRSSAKHLAHASLGRPALAAKLCEDKEYHAKYVETASSFLLASLKDLNERILIVESLVDKVKSDDLAVGTKGILDIWTGVVRDLMLLNNGVGELTQNDFMQKELARTGSKYSAAKLVRLYEALAKAKAYVNANVSPRLVLENVMMQL